MSQVNKLLMTLVVIVIMLYNPRLNVIIGGDARQIPCPPDRNNSPNTYFFESALWDLLGVRFCEVTRYLRDPVMADVMEAIADGRNDKFVHHWLNTWFVDKAAVVLPPGAVTLHVFSKNRDLNDCNAWQFAVGTRAGSGGPGTVTRLPWFVGKPTHYDPTPGKRAAFGYTLMMIECSI